MDSTSAVAFSAVARLLAVEAGRRGLLVPAFRSPPRTPGRPRTVRRLGGGCVLVAVRLRGRTADEVVADMVEGVVVANRLTGPAADGVRTALTAAVDTAPTSPFARTFLR